MGLFSRRKPPPAFVVPPEVESFASKHQTLTARRFFPRITVWDGTRFGDPHDYLVDSGSDFSIVSHAFATLHHFNLPTNPMEADLIDLEGLGGVRKAWLTKRYIRFEKLPEYRFSFHFVVPVPNALYPQLAGVEATAPLPPIRPIVGLADLLENFQVRLTQQFASFELLDGCGQPIDATGHPRP